MLSFRALRPWFVCCASSSQLFYSYFKTLVGKEVIVELKNDLAIRGTLQAVDQYLNIKLRNTSVVDEEKFPHMVRARRCQAMTHTHESENILVNDAGERSRSRTDDLVVRLRLCVCMCINVIVIYSSR